MWLIGVPQFVSFVCGVVWCGVVWCGVVCVCVCVCVCVRGVEEWGGVVPKHPCFLTHLNNEPDIAMSIPTERYPLYYFILVGVPNCVFVIFLYIYVLITYFCMFKFYFDYLPALSIVFIIESLILRLEHGVP